MTLAGGAAASIAYAKLWSYCIFSINETFRLLIGYSEPDEARRAALQHCKAIDATLLCCECDGWFALAQSKSNLAYGWGFACTPEDASKRAVRGCNLYTNASRLVICFSTLDGQQMMYSSEDLESNSLESNSEMTENRKLVFFIHGVSTKNAGYANFLIENIRKVIVRNHSKSQINFYSSFWGNLFNNKKDEIIDFMDKDVARAYKKHPEYEGEHLVYKYRQWRDKLIKDFIGDFLTYQNPKRGRIIRKTIFEQLNQFLSDHPDCDELHLVAHSLGSLILWDLLFSDILRDDDLALLIREKLNQIKLASITTLGSPLLFLKQFSDLDFANVNTFLEKFNTENNTGSYRLRWVNVIHPSDLVAYPLKAAIEETIGNNLLFCDQYVWQYANGTEKNFRFLGQFELAMIFAAEDAHSSYFYDNLDGAITGRLIAYNLMGDTKKLLDQCITPK